MNESEMEKRLDGLDDKTRKEVRKHMDEFHTLEEMEMFIKTKPEVVRINMSYVAPNQGKIRNSVC